MMLPPQKPAMQLESLNGIRFRKNSVRLPNNLTPMLAYFIGFLRDGTLDKDTHTYAVRIFQKDKEFLENVINGISVALFNKRAKIIESGADFAWQLSSKPLSLFIQKNFDYPKSFLQKFWDVPKIILESPTEIKKWYIAGFVDAEGSVCWERDRISRFISVYIYQSWNNPNECPPLFKIKQMLNEFNINCIGPQLYKKNSNAFRLKLTYRNSRKFLREIPLLKKLLPVHQKNLKPYGDSLPWHERCARE